MIFKTFDSKIDTWTSKIGIFGKSFNELGTAVNNAFKKTIDNIDNFDEKIGFWESLKNNLFPNKQDIKSLEISVPDLIDETKANKYLEIIKYIDNGTMDGIETFQDYYDTLANGDKWIAEYAQSTKDQIRSTEGVIKANQEARASALAHNETIKAQTLGAKAGAVALKGLAIAGNMLMFWAITEGIQLLVKGLDALIVTTEEASEATKEAIDTFESISSEVESLEGKIADLNEQIKELDPITNEEDIHKKYKCKCHSTY